MREKYESLAVKDLKEIAKIRGIKGVSFMSKAEVVDALVKKDEEEAALNSNAPSVAKEKTATVKKPRTRKAAVSKTETQESFDAKEAVDKENAKPKAKSQKEVVIEETAEEPPAKKASRGRKKTEVVSDEVKSQMPQEKPEAITKEEAVITEKADSETKSQKEEKPVKTSAKARSNKGKTAADLQTAENEVKNDLKDENKEDNKEEKGAYTVSPSERREVVKETPVSDKLDGAPIASMTSQPVKEEKTLDSGVKAYGILEVMPDGFGFIRCENFLPGENDVYVAPSQIRKFNLKTGDIIEGNTRIKTMNEKFSALLYLKSVNGCSPETIRGRANFEDMTPIFPNSRIKLETPGSSVAMRVMDLLSPVGLGQRGMIVSPPKAGKTTLLKEVAKSVKKNHPDIHMIILLIDERPEEVTDIKEAIEGPNVEVIYSTFDELPEHHKRVSEMVIERAKRLVEHHKDVMILLDSITRLTRAYNLTVPPSGRTLSGGLDPAALHMPKRFFGAARNMREGGSLTILATALVDTGSKMDDVVYEEFKGTGNMEMVLDRKLSEKRIFPAIDIPKSGTRRDDLLLSKEEMDAVSNLRRGINGLKPDECVDRILDMFSKTRSNNDFIAMTNKIHIF